MLIEIKETFKGPFSDIFKQFIQYKRSLGYKYTREAKHIQAIDRFSLNYDIEKISLSKEFVYDWTRRKEHETYENQKKRIYIIRQLAMFFQLLGNDAYLIPIENIKKSSSKFMPYIFTHEEILKLIKAADNLPSSKSFPNRQMVISTVIRVLYGCGLRVSEALNLNLEDINLKTGIITIKEGKKDNNRLVPMSISLNKVFKDFITTVHKNSDKHNCFFPNRFNERYSKITIYSIFRELLKNSGIKHKGRGYGPRLHDLRHTFAVHCLNKLSKEGIDIYTSLPILSTYLGHKSIEGTQQYLRLTIETYPYLIETVEDKCGDIFPEVMYDEK